MEKTSHKIVRNTVFNMFGRGWELLASLIIIPYTISKVGAEGYGAWVVVGTLTGYLAIMDVSGIGSAFAKYVAEYYAKKEFRKINQIISLGFGYYFLFSFFILFLGVFFQKWIISLFKFDPAIYAEVSFVIIGILVIGVIRGSFIVFRSVLLGLQRMDLTNIIAIVTSVCTLLGTFLFLKLGYGLKGLIYNGIIVAVITSSLQVFFAYRALPELKFRFFPFDKEIFLQSVSYGIKIQFSRIAELINQGVDKVLLGHYLGVVFSGLYEIGAKVANFTTTLPSILLPAIMPAASELDALQERARLKKLYERGTKYLVSLNFPLALFTVVTAPLIIFCWLGKPGYDNSILALQWLTVSYSVYLLTGMGRLVARGIGVLLYEVRTSYLIAVANITLSLILILRMGFIGALLGTGLATIVGSTWFLFSFHRYLKESFFALFKKVYLVPLFSSVVAGVLLVVTNRSGFSPATRNDALSVLLIDVLLFFSLYFVLTLVLNYFDRDDQELLTNLRQIIKIG
ncbi:MAG: oligosaccharide flippase family protein [Candidatus Omnitrophota bacterium]